MEPEKKNLFVRVLELATGITATTTVVVLSSVVGLTAYETYQPSALGAQTITAASAAVNSTTAPAACQQEIATAAARGFPDTQSVITSTGINFEDHCVAAVLNPAVTGLGPNNPGSYMCVGKTSKVTVTGVGLITETSVPNASIPAGTCIAVACGPADAGGLSGCIAANNLTSISGSNITADLNASQAALAPDQGITSFTMDSQGSIVSESGNTAQVLDSSANVQDLSGNAASLENTAPTEVPAAGSAPTSVTEPGTAVTQPTETVDTLTQTQPANQASAEVTTAPMQTNVPAATNVTPPESLPGATETNVSTQLPDPNLNGPQATTPTLSNNGGDAQTLIDNATQNSPDINAPQTTWEKFTTALDNGATNVINDVRSWMGLGPIQNAGTVEGPVQTIGIRG